jgi:hypothetical protein
MQTIEGSKMKFKSWFHLTMAIALGIVASKLLLMILQMAAMIIAFILSMIMGNGSHGPVNFM